LAIIMSEKLETRATSPFVTPSSARASRCAGEPDGVFAAIGSSLARNSRTALRLSAGLGGGAVCAGLKVGPSSIAASWISASLGSWSLGT
jgi:hypothetical protein